MGNDEQKLKELYTRRALAVEFKRIIDEETPKSDPRRAGAIAEYNRQIAEIDDKITAITGKPPDITIGLKPAILTGEVPR